MAGRLAARFLALVGFLALAGIVPLVADDAPCDCFALTAWTETTGLPTGSVVAITQSPDGYLWLGTTNGLVRFDGFDFQRWGARNEAALPGQYITDLTSSRDGTLWLGYSEVEGVSRLRDGVLTYFSTPEGFSNGPVTVIVEDSAGTVWVGGRAGLSVFRAGRWQRFGPQEGLPEAEVQAIYEDDARVLWVALTAGLFRRLPGADRFEPYDQNLRSISSMTQGRDGRLWIADRQSSLRALDAGTQPAAAANLELPRGGLRLLRDRSGDIWVAALGSGLLRMRPPGSARAATLEHFAYEHKFPGDLVSGARALFLDREDNVWVGMRAGGLLRIARSSLDTNIALAGLTNDGVRALAASADGSVWIATGGSLNRFRGAAHDVYPLPQIAVLHAAPQGDLWVATPQQIGRFRDGRFVPLSSPRPGEVTKLIAMTTDAAGDLWLCTSNQGLLRRHGDSVAHVDIAGIGHAPCRYVLVDRRGRVWSGFADGSLAVLDQGALRVYRSADGLAPGAVVMIYEGKDGVVWVSTAGGITEFADDRMRTVVAPRAFPDGLAPILVGDDDNRIWAGVNAGSALIGFTRQEFEKVAADPTRRLTYSFVDRTDGLRGQLIRNLSTPAAVRAADGRIWVLSGNGVVAFHPLEARGNQIIKPPRVDYVLANGREVTPTDRAVLPPRLSTLEIRYTSPSLSSSSKIRFRYLLEGFETEWTEVRDYRRAAYTNLPPGDYRFRVTAVAEGRWAGPETAWTFSVEPLFYQTSVFYALIAGGTGLLLWTLWRLRVRSIQNGFALVASERTRLSRDIHDTLLQSLTAVGLELEVLASDCEPSARASMRDGLRALRHQVRRCINEARRSIWDLRAPGLESRSLPAALEEFAADTYAGQPVAIDVRVTGRHRRCAPQIEEELLRIGQEAIRNAMRHAHADRVTVSFHYSRNEVVLSVADDGSGLVRTAATGQPGEHWGLRNMEERAARIKGRFRVDSQPGRGTVVETAVPLS
ncbi:MAG: two-component regulator propeller domain-containing protein [Acidobacteriota bacterium]